ncbi:hypothetical protein GCM10009780_13210 [Actinomadura alba]
MFRPPVPVNERRQVQKQRQFVLRRRLHTYENFDFPHYPTHPAANMVDGMSIYGGTSTDPALQAGQGTIIGGCSHAGCRSVIGTPMDLRHGPRTVAYTGPRGA